MYIAAAIALAAAVACALWQQQAARAASMVRVYERRANPHDN